MSKLSNTEFIRKVKEFFTRVKSIADTNVSSEDMAIVKKISDYLELELKKHDLPKIKIHQFLNSFKVKDNLIYFYAANDGMPTCPFEFYSNGEKVIGNSHNYCEIANLDEILIQMVRIYKKSLDSRIVLDPYFFMLELTDPITPDYHGNAKLVITEKAVRNQKLNDNNFDEANQYFINQFLDHFMGWNFGLSVKRSEELRKELEELNEKAMYMGIRKAAGTGFEVCCVDGYVEHYDLPEKKVRERDKEEEKAE